jgi:CheY-like chemotaxis protein
MDGIQAVGILRADPRMRAIPLAALTALAMPTALRSPYDAGGR